MNRRQFLAAIPALYATACFGSEPEPEIVYVSSFGLGKYKSHHNADWLYEDKIFRRDIIVAYENGFECWSWGRGEPETFPVWPETAEELFVGLGEQKVLFANRLVDGEYVSVYSASTRKDNFMSESNDSKSSGGISFLGLLAILFIGLKLTGYIDWSWWWVTAPLWGPLAAVLLIVVIALLCVFLSEKLSR